jgi:ABC-2 type transport system permease protein
MNSPYTPPRARPPRAAFGAILRNEARLAWRQPAGAIAAIGISLLIMVIFGELPVFKHPSSRLDGLSTFQIYIPILISFSIGLSRCFTFPARWSPTGNRASSVACQSPLSPLPGYWPRSSPCRRA